MVIDDDEYTSSSVNKNELNYFSDEFELLLSVLHVPITQI
jgi:hypothetical protein